jgi:hypothetical protein
MFFPKSFAAWLMLAWLALASSAKAVCVPFPCTGCQLLSQGQLNWVIMDRNAGEIRLIPNIRLNGNSPDFALVVPTPSLPQLSPVDRAVWQQALDLTAPVASRTRRNGSTSGCGSATVIAESSVDAAGGGVVVHGTDTVGGFVATFLSSDDPDALVQWLQDNDFGIAGDQADLFAPYVERGWFFTAMKPDPADPPQMPLGGWDTNVDPVMFRFAADSFELPLPLLSINQSVTMNVVLFVVDEHRVALPGFTTQYANRIQASEHAAIRSSHPELGEYLTTGDFLTRLDRSFGANSDMSDSVYLVQAPDDDEFRRVSTLFGSMLPVELVVLFMGLGMHRAANAKFRPARPEVRRAIRSIVRR